MRPQQHVLQLRGVKIWADAKDENGACPGCGARVVWALLATTNQPHPFDHPIVTGVPEWDYTVMRSTEVVESTSHLVTCRKRE